MAKKKSTSTKKTATKKAAKKGSAGKRATTKKSAEKKSSKKTAKKPTEKKKPTSKKRPATKKSATRTTRKKPKPTQSASEKSKAPESSPQKSLAEIIEGNWCVPKVLESPGFTDKPSKLVRDTYPEDGTPEDFLCFGPPAVDDGEFDDARICDMGCFNQEGKDSNKYYHGAVVQHRGSHNWYAYFEWGRTGATARSFQFIACAGEADARTYFAKQLHTKNDRRGEWVSIAGHRTLQAKKGKDCYLVRPMATRTTGLPDARNVKVNEGSRAKRAGSDGPKGDPSTLKLLRDLRTATIHFTKRSMADASIPTQAAVDEARAILGEATKRLLEVGDDFDTQVEDRQLGRLTNLLFGRIPRRKRVGAPPETWVLSRENVQKWSDDLDAFESALQAVDMELHPDIDILDEMNIDMGWLEADSTLGRFVHRWLPKATRGRHDAMSGMSIKNVWRVERESGHADLRKAHRRILRSEVDGSEAPRHQPRTRTDVAKEERDDFANSNTALLLHGTRGVNVYSILLESLRMPETLVAVPLTGAKFGPGLYFSDDWQKSADYSNAAGSKEAGGDGAVSGRSAFLFAADVVLGTPHVPDRTKVFSKPPRGHHSVFGKAGRSGVDHNEFVVYRPDQCRLRYLVEFETN